MSIEAMKQAIEALELMVTPRGFQAQVFCKEAYDNLRQAIAEAEKQEPVAWTPKIERLYENGVLVSQTIQYNPQGAKLPYPHEPKREWVGLTDEEIDQGQKESWVTKQAWESAVWWAEAKLKEKNT